MFNVREYMFLTAFVIIVQLVCVDTVSTTNTIRIFRNILQMKSWINNSKVHSNNISHQKIFIDEQLNKFKDIVIDPSIIDETNIENISSVMYVALECKCSETIQKILKKTIDLNESMTKINTTVLKTISVLLDFIDIAPNIISIEPGFLTTSLWINLQINKLNNFMKSNSNSEYTSNILKRMKFQMINLIERFTITNCSLDDMNENIEPQTSEQLFDYINDLLDNTGLLAIDFLELFQPINKSQKESTTFIVIIIQVVKKLDPILHNIEESLSKQMKIIENDTGHIFLYMELILDSITQIIYTKTLEALDVFKKYQREKNEKGFQLVINDWIDRDLVMTYDEIIQHLILLKFPSDFIHHIKLILKIVKDIINNKNILDLEIIRIQIKEKLNAIQNKNHSGLTTLARKNQSKFNLSAFLTVVKSIDEFKYFNQIYKLLQNGPVEYNLSETALNKMEDYELHFIDNSPNICDDMTSMYAHCYDIQSKIKACQKNTMCLKELKNQFLLVLNIFNDIRRKSLNSKDENINIILSWIHQYLNNNLVHFTHNTDKLNRMVYYITNLIDKYQIHNCRLSSYRNLMYESFTNSKEIKLKLLQYWETQNNVQYDLNVLETSFENKTTTEESLRYISIQNHIKTLNNLQFSAFYWRGTLKTIDEISVDKTGNMFNFSSQTKYVNTLHKWIISELFYTIVYILKLFLKDNYLIYNDRFIIKYLKKLPSIYFPEYVLPVIKTISSAKNFYYPFNIIGFQILLEQHLEQYSVIQKKPHVSDDMNVYKEKLNNMFDILMKIYNEKSNIEIHLKSNSEQLKSGFKKKSFKKPFVL